MNRRIRQTGFRSQGWGLARPDSRRAGNLEWGPFGRAFSRGQDTLLAKGASLRAKQWQEVSYCYFSQAALALPQTLRRKCPALGPLLPPASPGRTLSSWPRLPLPMYCVTSVSPDSLCTSGDPPRGFEALGQVQVSPYCASPPSPTSLGPSLPQPQVLPLQNLASPSPVLAPAPGSLTQAQDEER